MPGREEDATGFSGCFRSLVRDKTISRFVSILLANAMGLSLLKFVLG